MKLSLPPKLVEKLVWVPVISFCKIFIPSYTFDALLRQNWSFSPPNRLTLRITLLFDENLQSSIKQSTQTKGGRKSYKMEGPNPGKQKILQKVQTTKGMKTNQVLKKHIR